MTVKYRFIATQLGGSRAKIADLPLFDVQWQRLKNGAGGFKASLKLRPPVNEQNRRLNSLYIQATDRGTTCVYVMRNSVPVGAYILWDRNYDSDTQELSLSGAELFSYTRRRILEAPGDIDEYIPFDGTAMYDSVAVMLSMINDIGLTLDIEGGGPTLPSAVPAVSGVSAEEPGTGWRGTDAKLIGDIISEWSDADDAFDFRCDLTHDGTLFYRKFILRETLGTAVDITAKYGGIVGKTGANVSKFTLAQRGDMRATDVIAVGAASVPGTEKRFSGRATAGAFDPPLQRIISNNEEVDTTRLTAQAQGVLDAALDHQIIGVDMVAGSIDAEIGTFQPGDSFRFTIQRYTDAFFPEGLDITVRTIGFTVTVPDTEAKETISFQLEEEDV